MSELTIEQRVAAGAAYLDEHKPGWAADIDLTELDLVDPCLCVLGQLYGNYWRADPVRGSFGSTDCEQDQGAVAAMGFNAKWREDPHEEVPELRDLEVEWRRVIESRRAES